MSNTIRIEATLEDFELVVANHSRGKDFSKPAIEAIFNEISSTMDNNEDAGAVSVSSWLIAAGEQTSRDLVEYNLHLADDHTSELIDAASSIDFDNEKLAVALENEEGDLSSDDIWKAFKDVLLENDDFILEAADILAEAAEERYTKLSNDNWITFS